MSSITCSFLQKQIHHFLPSMKATECQETHAVCHATFLHETIGIQWYLRPILRPLHLLDGFFKSGNLSLLNSLLVCVQEGWGLFRYSGFSDLCNTGQKVENEVCASLASCGQSTFLDQCVRCLYNHANCPQIGLILSTLAACIAKVTKTTASSNMPWLLTVYCFGYITLPSAD